MCIYVLDDKIAHLLKRFNVIKLRSPLGHMNHFISTKRFAGDLDALRRGRSDWKRELAAHR